MNARSLTNVLTALAVLLGMGELGDSIVIRQENYADAQPVFAVIFALLFLLGAGLLRRAQVTTGMVLVAALCLFEVVSFSGWTRHNAFDWVSQSAFALVSLVALGLSVALLVARRRAAPAAA